MTTKQRLEAFWEKHPHLKERKHRRAVIEQLADIDFEQYVIAATVDRYYRKLPQDGREHERQHQILEELGYHAASVQDYAERQTLL